MEFYIDVDVFPGSRALNGAHLYKHIRIGRGQASRARKHTATKPGHRLITISYRSPIGSTGRNRNRPLTEAILSCKLGTNLGKARTMSTSVHPNQIALYTNGHHSLTWCTCKQQRCICPPKSKAIAQCPTCSIWQLHPLPCPHQACQQLRLWLLQVARRWCHLVVQR